MKSPELEPVHRLWDELADFPAENMELALHHCLKSLAGMVGAGNGYWIGGVRVVERDPCDPLQGWRPGGQHYLHPYTIDVDASKALARQWKARTPDPSFQLTRRDEGKFRSILHRRDLPSSWFRSQHYLHYHASRGIYDTLMVCFPLNEDVESWFAFQRTTLRRRFSSANELLLLEALRPLRWFHRQLAITHGLGLANSPLTPTQRRVLHLLLSEKSEKEMAIQLGQSYHTTHEHVVNLFAKFGVKGRSGLMALWLGSRP
jgi:DNA-binding CsgD family transcriptional regulator